MSDLVQFLLEMLGSTAIIWAATMAFKRAFREKLSPRAHVLIWGILIARLILPVTLDTGLHLIELPAKTTYTSAADTEEAASTGTPFSESSARREPAGAVAAQTATAPPVPSGDGPASDAGTLQWTADPDEIVLCVWIVGMLTMAAITIHAYAVMKRDVAARMRSGTDPLHLLFQECMSELDIRRRVFLAVQSELAGPALMFPNIVLISEDMQQMNDDAVRMAFRHELTHFTRRDHVKALFLQILRIVWWFNPVVWFAVRSIREDIETACDCDVAGRLGRGGRKAYAHAVLSMFGRTETNQAVLGMAFGGARKNAERRIRGIYMKSKCRHGAGLGAVLLAGILGITCFTTACQPTPAAEAIVNKNEGTLENALVGQAETPDPEATTAPAAEYSVLEHWTETIRKADNFEIVSDTDVMMPEVSAYPVVKVAPRDLSQELADQLISRFAPGATFFEMRRETTKAEWERMILDMEDTLAADRQYGDAAQIAATEETLEEWRRSYEEAPEVAPRVPASTQFTYMTDYEGAVMEEDGPIYINIEADAPDGGIIQISARAKHPTDSTLQPYFIYTGATFATQSQDERNVSLLDTERASADSMDEPYRSEELDRINQLGTEASERLSLYAGSPIDLDEAVKRGDALLNELGIDGVRIFHVDRALCGSMSPEELYDSQSYGQEQKLTEPAVYMEFQRESGGIPCVAQMGTSFVGESARESYSAPFAPERGTIVMDKDWTVRSFSWDNPTQVVEIVAPDSELIPLNEAKSRLVDQLYRTEMAMSSSYVENFGLAYDIDEMKLVMGYIDVRNEPENALIVPAWYISAQGRQLTPEEGTGETILYNWEEFMINALDGSPILMPGTLQTTVGTTEVVEVETD